MLVNIWRTPKLVVTFLFSRKIDLHLLLLQIYSDPCSSIVQWNRSGQVQQALLATGFITGALGHDLLARLTLSLCGAQTVLTPFTCKAMFLLLVLYSLRDSLLPPSFLTFLVSTTNACQANTPCHFSSLEAIGSSTAVQHTARFYLRSWCWPLLDHLATAACSGTACFSAGYIACPRVTCAIALAFVSTRPISFRCRCPFCKKAKGLLEDLLADPADYEVRALRVRVTTRRVHRNRDCIDVPIDS